MAKPRSKRRSKKSSEPELVRRDGALCVYFVNTASDKRRPLETYADLVDWGQRSGVLSASQAERLGRRGAENPDDARSVLTRAQVLRGCLLRLFSAVVEGRAPVDLDLDALHQALHEAHVHRRLIAASSGGCRFVWRDGDELDRMLWPVLSSATWVLTSADWRRLGACQGDGCSLMFIDRSPGSPRKYCSQASCGRRIRAKKHYHKVVKPQHEAWQRQYKAGG